MCCARGALRPRVSVSCDEIAHLASEKVWQGVMIALVASLALGALIPPVKPVDTLTSGLASIARLPFGTDVADEFKETEHDVPPAEDLILYDVEGNALCRRVRETITYLDLCCTIKPCADGSRHRGEAAALSGKSFPFLVDNAAGVSIEGSQSICDHLMEEYGSYIEPLEPPPILLLALPDLFRWERGQTVPPAMRGKSPPAKPLKLYSYEGNQFCRLVREVLCELDLPYELRSTGKGSSRREELKELSGKTTAPYLIDPNSGTAMGESADIVKYLLSTYSSYPTS